MVVLAFLALLGACGCSSRGSTPHRASEPASAIRAAQGPISEPCSSVFTKCALVPDSLPTSGHGMRAVRKTPPDLRAPGQMHHQQAKNCT